MSVFHDLDDLAAVEQAAYWKGAYERMSARNVELDASLGEMTRSCLAERDGRLKAEDCLTTAQTALQKIANISSSDPADYVRIADDLAIVALGRIEERS